MSRLQWDMMTMNCWSKTICEYYIVLCLGPYLFPLLLSIIWLHTSGWFLNWHPNYGHGTQNELPKRNVRKWLSILILLSTQHWTWSTQPNEKVTFWHWSLKFRFATTGGGPVWLWVRLYTVQERGQFGLSIEKLWDLFHLLQSLNRQGWRGSWQDVTRWLRWFLA